jgi:sugar/nucleoside kinase (ribokinase family)
MKILLIGASYIDISGHSKKRIISYGTTQGSLAIHDSGMLRNTAEYLARLCVPLNFITAVGDDIFGKNLLNDLTTLGIDISQSLIIKDTPTTSNLSLIDIDDELFACVESENISCMITSNYIKNFVDQIPNILLIDDSLNYDCLQYLACYTDAAVKMLQPLSADDFSKISDFLNKFDIIQLNKLQAEALCGRLIQTTDEAKECAKYLVEEKGIKRVYILLDQYGSIAADVFNIVHVPAYKSVLNNKKEAEYAYGAGIVYSLANDFSLYKSTLFAQVCSSFALDLRAGKRHKFSLEQVSEMLVYGEKLIPRDEEL